MPRHLEGLYCLDEVEDVLYSPYTVIPKYAGYTIPWDEVECPPIDGDGKLISRRATEILEGQ